MALDLSHNLMIFLKWIRVVLIIAILKLTIMNVLNLALDLKDVSVYAYICQDSLVSLIRSFIPNRQGHK